MSWLFPPLEATPCGAASETGFYEVLPRDASGMASPGGYNLCFTDLATLTRVFKAMDLPLSLDMGDLGKIVLC